jgi:hypothetical protein
VTVHVRRVSSHAAVTRVSKRMLAQVEAIGDEVHVRDQLRLGR